MKARDVMTHLQKQKFLPEKVEVQPLTAEERQRYCDIHWARHDDEVQRQYVGQFVVPYQKQVVASGTDAEEVLEEAARKTGKKLEELPVVGILDPLQELLP